jgi:Cu-processing system permease protein
MRGREMSKILLIARITFKESIRNKALYGIFFLGIALFVANIIITGMFTWELGKVAVDVGLSSVSISGLLIIFFFSIHSLANDFERKTIYLILSRPITKAEYILGKFLGLTWIILLSSSVLGICSVISVKLATLNVEAYIPQHFSWLTFLLGLVFITLSLLVLMAISFFWICITSNQFTALLLSILTYFIGQNVENVINIIDRSQVYANNAFLRKVIAVVSWIFPNLASFDLKTTAAYGLPVNTAYLLWVAIYGISYIAVSLAVTTLIFQRRELG